MEAGDEICPEQKFSIPNTVLAYWAGELGGLGRLWVGWYDDVNALKTRGFFTTQTENWPASSFEWYIQSATAGKQLHGIFFWGHGFNFDGGGVLTDSDHSGDREYYSLYADWNPSYKLGLGILFACYSQLGRPQFSGGVWRPSDK